MKNKTPICNSYSTRGGVAIFLSIVLLLSYCSKPKIETGACTTSISFKQDVTIIFNAHCATAGCHIGARPTGSLSLDSSIAFKNLTTKGYVRSGDSKSSILYQQMTNASNPMPPAGVLPDSLVNQINCWISDGAKDN